MTSGEIKQVQESLKNNHREQATLTVGRDTNESFIEFKNSLLDNITHLKHFLQAVFKTDHLNCGELMGITEDIFSGLQLKMDAVLYLNAIYSSENYVLEHCIRVGLLANIFSNWLELDETTTQQATIAGFLHDYGMLQVPIDIIIKQDTLTSEEYHSLQEHTKIGSLQLFGRVDDEVRQAVLSHHERYDGSGYPRGLKGERISFLASLIGILDVYDSMTSNRSYSLAKCPFQVINYFEREMITKFNPKLLYVFLENIPYMYTGVYVKLSNLKKAKVVFINKNYKTMPIVQVEGTNEIIDLSANRKIKIVNLL